MFKHPRPFFTLKLFGTLTPCLLRTASATLLATTTALLAATALRSISTSVALATLFWFLSRIGFRSRLWHLGATHGRGLHFEF